MAWLILNVDNSTTVHRMERRGELPLKFMGTIKHINMNQIRWEKLNQKQVRSCQSMPAYMSTYDTEHQSELPF